ncbi:glycosyltransferase family 2 protein [Demequina sediminicola]|uniref:glycosyltransferase family 2 protein n=1 Tax=Demequina sediminicola TaxID=1095026 RepID=UPI001F2FFB11|nr:glycosyltransferase family 2 protein [Demequina sediminicola]
MIDLPTLPAQPPVSIVVPVKNEAPYLADAVAAMLGCGYAGELEVVLAVAPSDDATEEIARGLEQDERVRVVSNPSGKTPDALNRAIAAARFDVLVRMDGHALMPEGYVDSAVRHLRESGAANVGGRMVPTASEPFAKAVAVAMSSAWGLGGAGHRQGGVAGPADSVYLGAFRREALEDVGGYDSHYVRAQDWELNFRLREAGYGVWFVPEMQVPYSPRNTWRSLARQFWLTGQWRREVVSRHPETKSLRYLAAPIATVAVVLGALCGVLGMLFDTPWLIAGWVIPLAYLAGILLATVSLASRAGAAASIRLPLVLATMHLGWGAGFLRQVPSSQLDA